MVISGTHIRRSKALYAERRAALLSAIKSEGGGLLTVPTASTGLHLVTELPEQCDDQTSRGRGAGTADWSHSAVGILCRCFRNKTTRLADGIWKYALGIDGGRHSDAMQSDRINLQD
jgi:hypothetical protein